MEQKFKLCMHIIIYKIASCPLMRRRDDCMEIQFLQSELFVVLQVSTTGGVGGVHYVGFQIRSLRYPYYISLQKLMGHVNLTWVV